MAYITKLIQDQWKKKPFLLACINNQRDIKQYSWLIDSSEKAFLVGYLLSFLDLPSANDFT